MGKKPSSRIIHSLGGEYLTIIRRRRSQYYSTILTEPEVNNCFSIITRSDLNRIRKETIEKTISLIGVNSCVKAREQEAVNSGCAKVRSLQ